MNRLQRFKRKYAFPLIVWLFLIVHRFYLHSLASLASNNRYCENLQDCADSPSPVPFTFSACLLVKDDNRLLPEWLAYHYEVLPLRHLIIAVDPYSKTSPAPILEKYREIGMTIELWHDQDYGLPKRLSNPKATSDERYKFHRKRQPQFLSACLDAHKRNNRTWTTIIDSDEYLIFNYYDKDEACEPWTCSFDKNRTSRAECNDKFQEEIQSGEHPRMRSPKIGESTVAHYLANELNRTDLYWHLERPCMVLPRVLFSPEDSFPNETHAQVPQGFDPYAFYTLRYRKHHAKSNKSPGKPIIDVSQYDGHGVSSPHRVSQQQCVNGPFVSYAEAMFRVQHYMGPKEVFTGRKSVENFETRLSSVNVAGSNDDARGWLQSFVNRIGKDKARELTEELRASAFEEMQKLSQKQTRLRA